MQDISDRSNSRAKSTRLSDVNPTHMATHEESEVAIIETKRKIFSLRAYDFLVDRRSIKGLGL